jgi:hypothetical protein
VTLPYVILPWTIPALVGLWVTGTRAVRQRFTPERFLWTWALLTPAAFSIPDGKHHHYLLQCMAPWAILGALGAVRIWQAIQHSPAWSRSPLAGLLALGLPGELALWAFGHRIPGPSWIVPILLIAWPILVLGFSWVVSRRDGRLAAATVFALLAVCYGLFYTYQTNYLNSYRDDMDLLRQVRARVKPDEPLFINFDGLYLLETFHLLYYSDEHAVLLHNLTFLLDERIKQKEVYVLARAFDSAYLSSLGSAEVVLQSKHTKGERLPADRRTLFHLCFRDDLPRVSGDVRISPMQATYRAAGPFLLSAVAQGR